MNEVSDSRRSFADQMGNTIFLNALPERIVSLVPSQTELIFSLGRADKLAGRTKFCIHPKPGISEVPVIGGTKTPDFEKIIQLQPDLIIGNKEENDRESVEKLKGRYPVWMSDIENFNDAIQMIRAVGQLVDADIAADKLVSRIVQAREQLKTFAAGKFKNERPGVLYMIWKKPYMAAGTESFISEMLHDCGFVNVATGRYPEFSAASLASLQPQFIFLSSEPYPFREKHVLEIQEICPESRIVLVDGEMFSWYGSRMQDAYPYFKQLLTSL